MEDSGERQEFTGGAVRDAMEGKPRPELISPYATEREAIHMMRGALKYKERNCEKGFPFSRCVASMERHIIAFKKGLTDEDHLAAIRCNAGFLIHYEEMIARGILPASLDDMPHYEDETGIE